MTNTNYEPMSQITAIRTAVIECLNSTEDRIKSGRMSDAVVRSIGIRKSDEFKYTADPITGDEKRVKTGRKVVNAYAVITCTEYVAGELIPYDEHR